ncbi:BAG family molecular chaperone regulator 4 [Coffea arabica]|nr:BAG family molecular chaperone regulator 4-like [Coffea arabica]
MKRSSLVSSKGRSLRRENGKTNNEEVVVIEWEVRPGGLLVQKRGAGPVSSAGPMIKIKVSHDSYHHDVTVPSQSTFGDLKRILASKTGLEPMVQRLLFRGKEKDDDECLHIAGVEDTSKIILLEDPASKERKFEEMRKHQDPDKAYEAVANVRAEVDKLSDKVVDLEKAVQSGNDIAEKEFVVLTELLMIQLLKLDSIEAYGKAREQRRIEVHRVQSFVDKLDNLKARNCIPFSNCGNASFVTAKWETFHSGFGSLTAPKPFHHSPKVFEDWESFD